MSVEETIENFIQKLTKHAIQKSKFYDGFDKLNPLVYHDRTVDYWIRYLAEEVGEVASAVTRDRHNLARDECIDVAHVAMLLYILLDYKLGEGQNERT